MKDKGLGDTIERFTKATGIKKMVDKVTGEKDCGCNKRKNKLNSMFSYSDQKKNLEDNINDFSEEMIEDLDKYPRVKKNKKEEIDAPKPKKILSKVLNPLEKFPKKNTVSEYT